MLPALAARTRSVRFTGGVVLIAGPTVLAFFSGGYFDQARAWAGVVAWALAALALIATTGLPRSRTAWMAIGALALLGAWTLASVTWAPVAGNAYHSAQLVFLYAGALLAGALLLEDPRLLRLLEPGLLAGVVIVIGYALSERLLPGVLHFAHSITAQGRLEQPLTYWNATGELAALGVVLAARVAGDPARPAGLRALAAAAAPPLVMGLYLTFSRGAAFACVAGMLVLFAAAPRREQLGALLLTLVSGVFAVVTAASLQELSTVTGPPGSREREGAIALAVLVVLMLAGAAAQLAMTRHLRSAQTRTAPRHSVALALAVSSAGLAAVIAIGGAEGSARQISTGTGRFVTLASNRYDFWRVALRAFAAEPLRGVGAGGWQVWWLRYRSFPGFARDAHSLPLQTAAELGLVGVVLLGVFFAGVALRGRSALRIAGPRAAGPLAGVVTYVAHAPLDWDWQMPALTLMALLLAGGLLALPELQRGGGASRMTSPSARAHALGEPRAESASAYQASTLSGSRVTTRSTTRRAARKSP